VKPFSLREAKTAQTQNYVAFAFAFKNASARTELKTKKPITPSSAAVFKLWFYGIFLRSKTIKPRLKNCPRSVATDAATTC